MNKPTWARKSRRLRKHKQGRKPRILGLDEEYINAVMNRYIRREYKGEKGLIWL